MRPRRVRERREGGAAPALPSLSSRGWCVVAFSGCLVAALAFVTTTAFSGSLLSPLPPQLPPVSYPSVALAFAPADAPVASAPVASAPSPKGTACDCGSCIALLAFARAPPQDAWSPASCDCTACAALTRLALHGAGVPNVANPTDESAIVGALGLAVSASVADALRQPKTLPTALAPTCPPVAPTISSSSGGMEGSSSSLPPAPRSAFRDVVFPRAALIVIFSEHRRSLLSTLANWAANAWWMTRYEFFVFYVEGKADPADIAKIATLAPLWKITMLPFSYDPSWQSEAYTGGGGGGPYISWLLAHEIYFSIPALSSFDYFMRMDDDISFISPSVGDPFLDLALSGARVGWKQLIPDNDGALSSDLFPRAQAFSASLGANLSSVWPLVSVRANRGPNTISDWRPYLVAGCVEIYATSVFRTPVYQAYLAHVGAVEGLKRRAYWEQEVKTMWMQLSVPIDEWKCIACVLPLRHKDEAHHDNTWFVHDQCDYQRGVVMSMPKGNRGNCDLDPQLRIC